MLVRLFRLESGENGRLVASLFSPNQSTKDVNLVFTLENRDKQKSVSKSQDLVTDVVSKAVDCG